jgi:hypothetical protein
MKKKLFLAALTLVTAFTLTACKQLDVIGNTSTASFQEVLKAIPDNITEDEQNGGWSIKAPDNSVRFIWSKDFSFSKTYDVMLEFDAKPFIDAGLDVNQLPNGMVTDGKIILGTNLGDEAFTYAEEAAPIDSYEKIVELRRDSVQYHGAMDHFGVNLDNGNLFEWAKDMSKNDKDIVFVLNPQVFIDAGVDPAKVEGWALAKVETMDMKGKTIEVDKFVKPFDLI